jgi:hypothetical protein
MIRPVLSLERLSFDEKEGKVCYRHGKEAEEVEGMDYLEFIARVTSHIPEKGQVMVRYFHFTASFSFRKAAEGARTILAPRVRARVLKNLERLKKDARTIQ